MSKRHVHMLDLDTPSRPRLRKSACKACKAREAELAGLREALERIARGNVERDDYTERRKAIARRALEGSSDA